MPKALSEYTLADWKRLRPLAHRLKTARYWLIDRRYRARPAAVGDAAAVAKAIAGRKVLFSVAYQDPQAIDWQAALVRHFVPGALYIVVDNSPQDADANAIEAICARHEVTYLRAPPNPWAKSSRSHGIVLNWIWHNIVRPGAPEAFGLIDHDLFPDRAGRSVRAAREAGHLRLRALHRAAERALVPVGRLHHDALRRGARPRSRLRAGLVPRPRHRRRQLGPALQQARSRHAGAGAVALPAVSRRDRAASGAAAMVRRLAARGRPDGRARGDGGQAARGGGDFGAAFGGGEGVAWPVIPVRAKARIRNPYPPCRSLRFRFAACAAPRNDGELPTPNSVP